MSDLKSSKSAATYAGHSQGFFHSLIDSLQHLLLALKTKIHHRHMERSKLSEIKGDYDLWSEFGAYIESTPVVEKSKEEMHTDQVVVHHNNGNFHPDRGGERSELSQYYHRQMHENAHPHLGEKMQEKTFDHINSSLHMARKGDQKGARLHIELAQSALQTASRFMSHEDYELFENRIQERLQSIIAFDHGNH